MIPIKRLTQNGEIFLPQTSAEAVIVKNGEEILTLDKVLQKNQIITPENSGLIIFKEGFSTSISHSNKIIPSNNISKVYKITYDQNGHISNTSPTNILKISTINKECVNYDGNSDQEVKFGDDFIATIDNTIKLNWINI